MTNPQNGSARRSSSFLQKGSLFRHLIIRLIPALLVLIILDFSATLLIMQDALDWVVKDIFIVIIVGQLLLVVLFAWLVFYGVRSGLHSVNMLAREISQRSEEDLQPIELHNVPTELLPLLDRLNDLLGKLDESLVAQRRFIGHAAHQFRTPLAGLRLESELMLARTLPDDVRERAERIKTISNRLIHLGQQLLVLARADPGIRPQDVFTKINLCEWVQNAGLEWVPRTRQHGVDLFLDAPDTPVWIDGDVLLLEELLGNLIDNALKYAQGASNITLTVGSNPPSLTVRDDGCGIDPDDAAQIFDAFYRSPKAGATGTGLGLTIVREITRAHGAWWSLLSRPQIQGTQITVIFPGPRIGTRLTRSKVDQ